MIWERDIYVTLLNNKIREENEKIEEAQRKQKYGM